MYDGHLQVRKKVWEGGDGIFCSFLGASATASYRGLSTMFNVVSSPV